MLKTTIETELERGYDISLVSLVNNLVEYAKELRASDVHIDPTEQSVRVRFRIDGVLQDVFRLPSTIKSEIISRIKVLASLRTDEHQSAQDGRFRLTFETTGAIDIRVSIVPTYYGENAVLRLLSDSSQALTLENMGFNEHDREKIIEAIQRPYGMILATGPTGSGKTTTLYTMIKMLNTQEVAIITIEDPIEYSLDGINQIQVNPRSGLSFANGLRSVLRQDPDSIMVGEIRDAETAMLAVNTALTGHLLLSTLHTNDAATTLPRLLDMGIEPYLIASTVNLAIGQRLVRKICEACKYEKEMTEGERKSLTHVLPAQLLADAHGIFFAGQGCEACNQTGYSGRIGIYEILVVDADIREAFLRKASALEIKKLACKNGMTSMLEDGFKKAQAGLTTIEEVLRVIHE